MSQLAVIYLHLAVVLSNVLNLNWLLQAKSMDSSLTGVLMLSAEYAESRAITGLFLSMSALFPELTSLLSLLPLWGRTRVVPLLPKQTDSFSLSRAHKQIQSWIRSSLALLKGMEQISFVGPLCGE